MNQPTGTSVQVRIALLAGAMLWLTGLVWAVPVPPRSAAESKDDASVPSITEFEARQYADRVTGAIQRIAREYVTPVEPSRLAAAALRGLHRAAGVPLPNHLQGDLEKYLAGRNLNSELRSARRALGRRQAIQGEKGVQASIEAMLQTLDPFCAYLHPDERRLTSPTVASAGIRLEEDEPIGSIFVRSVLYGGPAVAAGVVPGDQILEINGRSVADLDPRRAMYHINNGGGTVTLTLRHRGEKEPVEVRVPLAQFSEETVLGVRRKRNRTWDYWLDRSKRIALIRLTYLERSTPVVLERVLSDLSEDGLRGLILDLRECPGGYVSNSEEIADMFLPGDKVIARYYYRRDQVLPRRGGLPPPPKQRISTGEGSFTDFPLVVLVDPGTSGGGELVAAALQDHGRARIAGQRSRGKASIQQSIDIDGDGLPDIRLTIGKFVRKDGKNLQRTAANQGTKDWGILPDAGLEVRTSVQMRRLIREWRFRMDQRSPHSRQALPLDDPRKDPVLYAGLQYLYEKNSD